MVNFGNKNIIYGVELLNENKDVCWKFLNFNKKNINNYHKNNYVNDIVLIGSDSLFNYSLNADKNSVNDLDKGLVELLKKDVLNGENIDSLNKELLSEPPGYRKKQINETFNKLSLINSPKINYKIIPIREMDNVFEKMKVGKENVETYNLELISFYNSFTKKFK